MERRSSDPASGVRIGTSAPPIGKRQPAVTAPNALWSMDFVSDALFDGRRFRALTVVDAFTREALAIEVDQGIEASRSLR